MNTDNVVVPTTDGDAPTVEPYLVECKFTIERREGFNSATSEKRVTFDGYATDALYVAVMDAIKGVLHDND